MISWRYDDEASDDEDMHWGWGYVKSTACLLSHSILHFLCIDVVTTARTRFRLEKCIVTALALHRWLNIKDFLISSSADKMLKCAANCCSPLEAC